MARPYISNGRSPLPPSAHRQSDADTPAKQCRDIWKAMPRHIEIVLYKYQESLVGMQQAGAGCRQSASGMQAGRRAQVYQSVPTT